MYADTMSNSAATKLKVTVNKRAVENMRIAYATYHAVFWASAVGRYGAGSLDGLAVA